MPLSAGSALAHFRIVSRLGAGEMGEVYRAQDTRLDRTVALKALPAEFCPRIVRHACRTRWKNS